MPRHEIISFPYDIRTLSHVGIEVSGTNTERQFDPTISVAVMQAGQFYSYFDTSPREIRKFAEDILAMFPDPHLPAEETGGPTQEKNDASKNL